MKENKYDKGALVFKRNKDIWISGLLSANITTYNSNFKEPTYQFMVEYSGKLLINESNEMKDICTRRGIEKLKEIKTQIEAIITEIEAGGPYAG